MKKISAALVCVALLVANLVKYWPEGARHASTGSRSVAGASPEVVGFGQSYRIGAVDLFATGPEADREGGPDQVQAQPESAGREAGPDTSGERDAGQPAIGEEMQRPARGTGFELLSVAEIAGVKKGLVKYRGRHYFVSPGDVIDGKFVVQRIDDKRVYLKSAAGSGSQ